MTQSKPDGGGARAKSNDGPRPRPAKVTDGPRPRRKSASKAQSELPGWTNGLRQLYDQVVDEDLPASFRDLLARLDDQS